MLHLRLGSSEQESHADCDRRREGHALDISSLPYSDECPLSAYRGENNSLAKSGQAAGSCSLMRLAERAVLAPLRKRDASRGSPDSLDFARDRLFAAQRTLAPG